MGVLDGLNRADRRPYGKIGPREVYGPAYHLLKTSTEDEQFEPIRRMVRDFATETMSWDIGTDILGSTVTERLYANVRSAAFEAGVDGKTMRKIFDRRGRSLAGAPLQLAC